MNQLSKGQLVNLLITHEDFHNSGKNFGRTRDCPATIAVQRQLGIDATLLYTKLCGKDKEGKYSLSNKIGILKDNKQWDEDTFKDLEKGIEFHVEITIL